MRYGRGHVEAPWVGVTQAPGAVLVQSETLLGEQTQPAVRRQDGAAVRREREIEDHRGARAPTGWWGAGPDAQDPPCHPPAFREGWLSLLQRLDELGWRGRAWLSGKGDGGGAGPWQ